MTEEAPITYTITPEQFTQAVADAAERVDKARTKRLVLVGFIAGLAASALVVLPVVFFSAKANCNSITALAQAAEHRFVDEKSASKRFLKTSKDRLGLSESDFQALIRRSEARTQAEIDSTRRVARRDCALI